MIRCNVTSKKCVIRLSVVITAVICCWTSECLAQSNSTSKGEALAKEEQSMRLFFSTYCARCHGEKEQNGDVRLDQLEVQIVDHSDVSKWQDVLDVLNTGEMPPEDQKQPKKDELTSAIGLITQNISSAHKRLAATGGVISMRHLTKREYLGSMKDLFGIDLPPDLVPDDVSGGFDTNGSEQFFSLKQYENFYKAGRLVVESSLNAYTSQLPEPSTVRHDPEIVPAAKAKEAYEQMVKVKELIEAGAPFSEISKVNPKVADEGQAKLFIKRYPIRSKKPIANYENTKGKKGVSSGFTHTTAARPRSLYKVAIGALKVLDGDIGINVNGKDVGTVKFKSGESQTPSKLTFSTSIFESEINIKVTGRRNDVYDYLTLAGPFEDTKTKPGFFESVVKPVVQSSDPSDSEIAAMLKGFAERAFRYQGVDDEYIGELVKVYQLERSLGKSVADSLVEPLTSIITAPAFLYIKEKNDGKRSVLSQTEFAIRVAYFLWGAPPDQELYDLAKSGKLYNKARMKAQFERMLASEKADAFLTDFINQWADIERFDEIDLPVKLIRSGFQSSARQELSEFFSVLVRENKPVENLIDSDFVMVNAKLAQTYGLKANRSGGFQKVALPDSSPRGGMLTQAAFLIIGGSGPRTSPTIRGALIREKFLNDPVPSPPPNIPAIENEKGKKLTVKQLVDRHKSIPQCASCHNKIDPIGYGLENFDYLGNWRTSEVLGGETAGKKSKKKKSDRGAKTGPKKVTIEPSGYLGDDQFEDLEGLQQVLLKNKDKLARSIYESLLSYGIGRDIEFVDEDDINENLTELRKRNYLLKEMIFEVITSKTFLAK